MSRHAMRRKRDRVIASEVACQSTFIGEHRSPQRIDRNVTQDRQALKPAVAVVDAALAEQSRVMYYYCHYHYGYYRS